jgi:hypothetical protein
MARNVIERIFGVLKHHFRILIHAPRYNLQIQARIPAAMCTIHNFIRLHDPQEGPLPDADSDGDLAEDEEEVVAAVDEEEAPNDMKHLRDRIAEDMWTQYQQVLSERALASDDDVDDEDLLEFGDGESADDDEDMDGINA